MKPTAFDYHAPANVEDALSVLNAVGTDAKILAGGQSLGPMLNFRVARPTHIIDIGRIELLRHISVTADGCQLGAAVSHSTIEDYSAFPGTGDAMPRVAQGIAYRAIRNKGTIGGSLAHADPSADWPVVMSALDATIEIASLQEVRRVSARQFFVDQLETVLGSAELLLFVHVPALPTSSRFGYSKITRKTGEFADSIVSTVIRFGSQEVIEAADIWLGAAKGTPQRLEKIEEILTGSRWNGALKSEVKLALLQILDDAETDYERHRAQLHCVNLIRAIDDAHQRQ